MDYRISLFFPISLSIQWRRLLDSNFFANCEGRQVSLHVPKISAASTSRSVRYCKSVKKCSTVQKKILNKCLQTWTRANIGVINENSTKKHVFLLSCYHVALKIEPVVSANLCFLFWLGLQPFLPLSAPSELVIPPAPTPVTTDAPTDVDVKPPEAPDAWSAPFFTAPIRMV